MIVKRGADPEGYLNRDDEQFRQGYVQGIQECEAELRRHTSRPTDADVASAMNSVAATFRKWIKENS